MTIDGNWSITVESPMGPRTSTFNFTSDGGTLKGTATDPQGSQEITEGKVDGDNVSWKAAITTPMPMTLAFVGVVSEDKIAGNVTAGAFGKFPFSGTRD